MLSDEEREKLVALFPWVFDFDAALRPAKNFADALVRLRTIPVRKVGQRKRRAKKYS